MTNTYWHNLDMRTGEYTHGVKSENVHFKSVKFTLTNEKILDAVEGSDGIWRVPLSKVTEDMDCKFMGIDPGSKNGDFALLYLPKI